MPMDIHSHVRKSQTKILNDPCIRCPYTSTQPSPIRTWNLEKLYSRQDNLSLEPPPFSTNSGSLLDKQGR